MKIKLSKSQWEMMGKTAGWMKKAQAPSTAQQIGTAFQGLAGGIAEAGNAKVQEYAQRIMKGEPKEKVLEGQGSTMIKNVEAALAQLQKGQQAVPSTQQAQQPQGKQDASGWTFTRLMQDPNFKQTFETLKKQKANEKQILQYWKSMNIQYESIPEILSILG